MHPFAKAPDTATIKSHFLQKAEEIAALFEFGDAEVSKCVHRFLQQMGVWAQASCEASLP